LHHLNFQVDLLLKGEERATTETIESTAGNDPRAWTDADVGTVVKEMLAALDRRRHPNQPARPVFLRGISWIVDRDRTGAGVVIALEIPTGAAVAGPFEIAQHDLEEMMTRVMSRTTNVPPDNVIH
jgi:hypothetical protein